MVPVGCLQLTSEQLSRVKILSSNGTIQTAFNVRQNAALILAHQQAFCNSDPSIEAATRELGFSIKTSNKTLLITEEQQTMEHKTNQTGTIVALVYSIASVLIISIFSLFGILFYYCLSRQALAYVLEFFIGMGAGCILADALLHKIPGFLHIEIGFALQKMNVVILAVFLFYLQCISIV